MSQHKNWCALRNVRYLPTFPPVPTHIAEAAEWYQGEANGKGPTQLTIERLTPLPGLQFIWHLDMRVPDRGVIVFDYASAARQAFNLKVASLLAGSCPPSAVWPLAPT